MMGTCDRDTTFEILDRYKSLGGNFIDLANNYQAGQSETWVGEWLAERNCRG
jgi:aryl-alcohol dehydrogenase-like predicted oxidoreductase